MQRFLLAGMLAVTAAVPAFVAPAYATPAYATPAVGRPAPAFTAVDSNGQRRSLAALKGRTVVLEWNNPSCPFVRKHYGSGNMQALQKAARADDVVWLTINSGAPGKEGHLTSAEANSFVARQGAAPSAYLLDPDGEVGRAYDAKTTPHMYVIDAAGNLAYAGAIDDAPTADPADVKTAKNYVAAALADVKAGRRVAVAQSRPYGCSVKY